MLRAVFGVAALRVLVAIVAATAGIVASTPVIGTVAVIRWGRRWGDEAVNSSPYALFHGYASTTVIDEWGVGKHWVLNLSPLSAEHEHFCG